MDLCIQGWIWCSSVAIWASNYWTLAIWTSAADGVEWEVVGVVILLGIDLTGVAFVALMYSD